MTTHPRLTDALLGGLIGSTTLTLIHETARRFVPEAPRVDIVGRRAIAYGLEAVGVDPPRGDALQATAMAGDIVSNALYYSLAGLGPTASVMDRSAILGAVGGLGAVLLPPVVGLGGKETAATPARIVMTMAWYLAGGLAAGAAMTWLSKRRG